MHLIEEVSFIKTGEDRYLMINLINAGCNLISSDLYNKLLSGNFQRINKKIIEVMKEKKFLFPSKEEYKNFINQLESIINSRENENAPAFFLIPEYTSDMNDIYSYEKINNIDLDRNKKAIDTLNKKLPEIDKIVDEHRNAKKIPLNNKDIEITIMSLEPLICINRNIIKDLFDNLRSRGYRLNIFSNGLDLGCFVGDLIHYKDLNMKLMIDITKSMCDSNGEFCIGSKDFQKIVHNVKDLLDNDIKVNLKIDISKDNIKELSKLSNFIVSEFSKNLNLVSSLYLCHNNDYLTKNYMIKEEEALKDIYEQEDFNSNIKIFDKKYHGSIFVDSILRGTKYRPFMKSCGAPKNQYVIDFDGNFYKCWYGLNCSICEHKIKKDCDKNDPKENVAINLIGKCSDCKYRYVCGSGNPVVVNLDNRRCVAQENCVDFNGIFETVVAAKLKN